MVNKKEYTTPILEIIFVEMESGIAANSTAVSPVNVHGEVKDEWEKEDDVSGDIIWD